MFRRHTAANRTPLALALVLPSLILARILDRSPPRFDVTSLPCGVVVSAHSSLGDRTPHRLRHGVEDVEQIPSAPGKAVQSCHHITSPWPTWRWPSRVACDFRDSPAHLLREDLRCPGLRQCRTPCP